MLCKRYLWIEMSVSVNMELFQILKIGMSIIVMSLILINKRNFSASFRQISPIDTTLSDMLIIVI